MSHHLLIVRNILGTSQFSLDVASSGSLGAVVGSPYDALPPKRNDSDVKAESTCTCCDGV